MESTYNSLNDIKDEYVEKGLSRRSLNGIVDDFCLDYCKPVDELQGTEISVFKRALRQKLDYLVYCNDQDRDRYSS